MEQIDEKLIEKTVQIGINTINDLEKQSEILNETELLLEDAKNLTKQSLRKVRGMTWWGSFLNIFYYNLFEKEDKIQNIKKSIDLEQGLNDDIDKMLDIALTMNTVLKYNNQSIENIEVIIDKIDDDFTLLKDKIGKF